MEYFKQKECIFKYPDGSGNVKLSKNVDHSKFVFRVNSYTDLWRLNQVVEACNFNGIRPEVTIPCLIDAQADRRFNSNESHGLKLVCRFLNGMNADFKIFHPHNPEVVEGIMDNVRIINNSDFLSDVLNSLVKGNWKSDHNKEAMDNLVIMSPDAGAYKWLNSTCADIGWKGTILNAAKSRVGGKVKGQQLPLDDFEGKDVLIVDDLSIYGGTFKGLATLLKEANCGKIYLAVSHMTIQNFYLKEKTDTSVFDFFDHIFTTDSKFPNYVVWRRATGIFPDNITVFHKFKGW